MPFETLRFCKTSGNLCRWPILYSGGLRAAIDSDKSTLFRSFYAWILSAANHIVYHSPIEKEKLVKLGLYNPAYCSFIPMGSDGTFFKVQQPTTNNQQPTTILAVGRDHARDYKTLVSGRRQTAGVEFCGYLQSEEY